MSRCPFQQNDMQAGIGTWYQVADYVPARLAISGMHDLLMHCKNEDSWLMAVFTSLPD